MGIKKIRRGKRWTKDDWELTGLAFPAFLWFCAFAYLPMFGIVIAFKNYKLTPGESFIHSLFQSEWCGLDNFKFFLTSNNFTLLLRNTILYNIVFIILGLAIPITLAIMINLLFSKRKAKVYQTCMFFPYFMSWVIVSYFVYAFLGTDKGIANRIITAFGGDPIQWYSNPTYWPFILVFMNLWKNIGYSMIIYLATITGIDKTLYEAAVIDGATKTQQIRYITLPSIKPVAIMMFILSTGGIFRSDFGLFYQVTQGVPGSLYNVASTFDTYIYNALRSNVSIGRTSAAAVFQSVACCITILTANYIVSKVDDDSSII